MKMRDTLLAVPFAMGLLAACGGGQTPVPAPEEREPPTVAVTIWTDKTELFMEYPPLVAGQEAKMSVAEGRVTIEVPGIELMEVVHLSLV